MDSRGAPERIRGGHACDQSLDLGVDGRAAPVGPAGERRPVLAEAAPLPTQDGGGGHDHEGLPPMRPDPGQPDPEETISRAKLRPARRSLVHGELLAQGEVLEGELPVAAAEEWAESKQVEQRADHWRAIVSGSEPKDQPLIRRTGFWRRTTGAVIASIAGEAVFAVLVTPIVLAFQTQFVLAVLRRTAVGWGSQLRGDTATALNEAVGAHAGHTLWGVTVSMIAYILDPHLFYWLVPSLAGLALSIPLSMGSSRASWGRPGPAMGLVLDTRGGKPSAAPACVSRRG